MNTLPWLDAAALARLLDYPTLIDALDAQFRRGCETPVRHHHTVGQGAEPPGTLLLMPAWDGDWMGIKVVTVTPGNGARGLPSIHGSYLLHEQRTGRVVAMLDGTELTARRTAAASALAARYLARQNAATLLMVGAGRLAHELPRAHAAVRPIRRLRFWARDLSKAQALAADYREQGFDAEAVTDLAAGCAEADIVSCATLSQQPLVHGAWLRPGTHLDLVGAYTPAMREADDDAVRRATLFVDTRAGALHEAGELLLPIQAGVITAGDVRAELAELCRGEQPGRRRDDEITLFKSVGTALEDLAAAILAWQRHQPAPDR